MSSKLRSCIGLSTGWLRRYLINRYFVTAAARMNLSGVISPLILRYMVKKGTKKDAFYAKESDWRYVIAASADVADHWRRPGAALV
ncbi:hypothetical protein E7T78_14515 [Salmonella enterica]|nr:hypothetical protein [Salmonella enterica]